MIKAIKADCRAGVMAAERGFILNSKQQAELSVQPNSPTTASYEKANKRFLTTRSTPFTAQAAVR